MKVEYSGLIYVDMAKYLAINDGFSFGQKLVQIEKEANKSFYKMTDEEMYNTLKSLILKKDYFKDEQLTEEEFNNWRENAITK